MASLRASIVKGARFEGTDEIVADMMILNLVWSGKKRRCEIRRKEKGQELCDQKTTKKEAI